MKREDFDRLVHRATDLVYEHLRKLGIPAGIIIRNIWGRHDPISALFSIDYGVDCQDKTPLNIAVLTEDGKLRFLLKSCQGDPDIIELINNADKESSPKGVHPYTGRVHII